MPPPDSVENLELDRKENPDYFNLADTCSELEKEYSRLQRQIENAPHQASAGHRPRLVRRRLQADRRRLDRRAEDWERELQVFLARPYLAVSGADKERTFSQALALLRDCGHRLVAHSDRLAQGLDGLRKLKRPPRNRYLGKVAIFIAPIALVLALIYLYWGGYFNLPRLPAADPTPEEVVPISQPGMLPEPAPERPADSLDIR